MQNNKSNSQIELEQEQLATEDATSKLTNPIYEWNK